MKHLRSIALASSLLLLVPVLRADSVTIEGDLRVAQPDSTAPGDPILQTTNERVELRGFMRNTNGTSRAGSVLLQPSASAAWFQWQGGISTYEVTQQSFYVYLGDENAIIWGYFDLALTSDIWSGEAGIGYGALQKRFSIGYNVWANSKTFYSTQASQIVHATGGMPQKASIGEPEKDPVTGAIRVPVYLKSGGRSFISVNISGVLTTGRNFAPGYPYITQPTLYTGVVNTDNAVQFDKIKVAGNSTIGGTLTVPTGNVGIGTATPTVKLEVAGDAKVQNLNVTGQLSLNGTPVVGGTTGLTLNAGGANQNITLTPTGSGNTIVSSGKVKIGSGLPLVPTQNLTIADSSTGSGAGIDFYNGQGKGGSIVAANSHLYFYGPNGGLAFTINDNKIRMGGKNIELNGGTISGHGNGGGLGVSTDNRVSIGAGNFTALSRLDVAGGVALGSYAGVSAAPANGLIVSGNIGVGINNPTEKLEVVGNTKITGDVTVSGAMAVNGLVTKLRVAQQGDISMGDFTAEPTP